MKKSKKATLIVVAIFISLVLGYSLLIIHSARKQRKLSNSVPLNRIRAPKVLNKSINENGVYHFMKAISILVEKGGKNFYHDVGLLELSDSEIDSIVNEVFTGTQCKWIDWQEVEGTTVDSLSVKKGFLSKEPMAGNVVTLKSVILGLARVLISHANRISKKESSDKAQRIYQVAINLILDHWAKRYSFSEYESYTKYLRKTLKEAIENGVGNGTYREALSDQLSYIRLLCDELDSKNTRFCFSYSENFPDEIDIYRTQSLTKILSYDQEAIWRQNAAAELSYLMARKDLKWRPEYISARCALSRELQTVESESVKKSIELALQGVWTSGEMYLIEVNLPSEVQKEE